jgi:NAD(P)H dehydrogenase (quinone)
MAPKIAVVYYSMWGHVGIVAKSIVEGIEAAGGKADLYQVAETLPAEVLTAYHAPPRDESIPTITPEKLAEYDGFLMGMPTRYGNMPAQWKAFWDSTLMVWKSGGLYQKYAGTFVCTGSIGGGQESTHLACMSTLAHHGIIYVPLGYPAGKGVELLNSVKDVRGGGPWGSGSFSATDGSRLPTPEELQLASVQGQTFYKAVAKAHP